MKTSNQIIGGRGPTPVQLVVATIIAASGLAGAAHAAPANPQPVDLKSVTIESQVRVNGTVLQQAIGNDNDLSTNLGVELRGANVANSRFVSQVRVNGVVSNTTLGNGNKSRLNLGISVSN